MNHRLLFVLTALIALALPASLRAEVYDLTTTTGRTYHQCRIVKIELDGLSFRHSGGAGKVLFTDLTKNWREHFGYDAEKAKAHADKLVQDRKKAREIAFQREQEIYKANQEAAEAQTLQALQLVLAQAANNQSYLGDGYLSILNGMPLTANGYGYNGYGYNGYGYGVRNNNCRPMYSSNSIVGYNGNGTLNHATVRSRSFSTGCQTYTPNNSWSVPGVGINVAPRACTPPPVRSTHTMAAPRR